MIFSVFQKNGFLGILGPPYCGIGATIRIGPEMSPVCGIFFKSIIQGTELLFVDIYNKVKLTWLAAEFIMT